MMGKYGGMEVSGANMGVGNNGGNVGLGVPRPRQSTLPLFLPRIGCIRTEVDDTRGLMDDLHDLDAS